MTQKLIREKFGKKKGKVGITCTIRDRVNNKTKSFTVHGYTLLEAYNSAYFHFMHEAKAHNKIIGEKNGEKRTDQSRTSSLRAINTATWRRSRILWIWKKEERTRTRKGLELKYRKNRRLARQFIEQCDKELEQCKAGIEEAKDKLTNEIDEEDPMGIKEKEGDDEWWQKVNLI